MQSGDDIRILARETVLNEISYRMDKLWRIFSWTSTVLVAMIGGTIALRTGKTALSIVHQIVLAVAAGVLGFYAVIWLRQNLRLERRARDALVAHDRALGIGPYVKSIDGGLQRPDRGIVVGYSLTVGLLSVAAIVAALIPL
jgi:hypothetical protein